MSDAEGAGVVQVFIGFLILATVVGGSDRGRRLRDRPRLVLVLTTLAAASFYSLRVVL